MIGLARRDASRLFRKLRAEALAAAIDHTRTLALFPDKRSEVEGQVLDLDWQGIKGHHPLHRLAIDDDLFGGKSLRVFFWPQ